ncbi:hypothetical protein TELCIR_06495 [Teladorsagia circumcincta]|uniref:Uncharacterized protein n=1 Tax=Teladorsagia circumcincta TaxID=45464 RepID=A0A2G9UMU3_TELCI|nr:hypothetical protein TELCIR_06495 [Teladorsagia circumcincta]
MGLGSRLLMLGGGVIGLTLLLLVIAFLIHNLKEVRGETNPEHPENFILKTVSKTRTASAENGSKTKSGSAEKKMGSKE